MQPRKRNRKSRFVQKATLKTKLSAKVLLGAAAGVLFLGVIIKILTLGFVIKPETAFAADCESSYTLDWGDPITYIVTCGDVNAGNWSVKGLTCYYYSPVINVGGSLGGPDKTVDFTVRINQSGNLDNNDTAWVYFYVNGAVVRTNMFLGGGSPAVFTALDSVKVPSAGNYQISILLKNDKNNELWQVKSKDVTSCVRSGLSPLAVTLTSFTARIDKDNTVLLKWTTIAEKNNDYFTIERSGDGTGFSELAQIESAGNSAALLNYFFMDESPLSGKSYYRLTQTDLGGKSEIFKIDSAEINDSEKEPVLTIEKIFPNPFNESFTIYYCSKDMAPNSFELFDEKGSFLFATSSESACGLNEIEIKNLSAKIKPGIYYMRCVHDGTITPDIIKLVKQ